MDPPCAIRDVCVRFSPRRHISNAGLRRAEEAGGTGRTRLSGRRAAITGQVGSGGALGRTRGTRSKKLTRDTIGGHNAADGSDVRKESLVSHAATFMERQRPTAATVSARHAEPHRHRHAPPGQAFESLVGSCRFSPVTVGFWLGGAGMGMGGCLLGALMPYRHPVAVTISVRCWGVYFGCFRASIGALIGVFTDRRPTRPCRISHVAGKGPTESGQADGIPGRGRGGTGQHSPDRQAALGVCTRRPVRSLLRWPSSFAN
jgi:hypothetical protein